MATLHVPQSPEGFAGYLRSYLSNSSGSGRRDLIQDHYEGWFIGNFFSIGYISRNAYGSKYHPIRNRMLGYIAKEENGSKVTWFRFSGFTDPIALVTIFLCCFIFLVLVRNMGGIIQAPTDVLLQYSVIFTAAAALVTYTSSKWSNEGALGHRRLKALLYPELMEKERETGDEF